MNRPAAPRQVLPSAVSRADRWIGRAAGITVALRDAMITGLPARMYEPDERGRRRPESLYGAVKAWAYLRRNGVVVARCTVERLMAASGWRGNTRASKTRTTVPDPEVLLPY